MRNSKKNMKEMKLNKDDLYQIGEVAYLHHEKAYYGEELVCVIFCSSQTRNIARMLADKALKCYGSKYRVVDAYDFGWGASLLVTNLRYDDMFECEQPDKEQSDGAFSLDDIDDLDI